jgi:FemAB-related protein (PEP-CTERM system-associated)
LCSLPYFDAAGLLAVDDAAARAILDEARRLMTEVKAQWVELRMMNPIDSSFPTREDKVTLRLPLAANEELLWKELKAKVRNQVRKAENAGLQAVHGGAELLDEFFAIYLRTMRDLGSPPHSRRFFSLIFESFGDAARLHVVRSGQKPVAASLTLRNRQTVCVPWAGSDWRVSELCGNMLLYWAMLSDACRSGAEVFDFGRSTRESGTYRFKQQWGAQEVPLAWQFLLAPGVSLPELRPDNPKYSMLVRLWKRLPLGVVRLLGPRVIAKLS